MPISHRGLRKFAGPAEIPPRPQLQANIPPRNIYVAPNGDIFVAESNTEVKGIKKLAAEVTGHAGAQRLDKSANRVTMLRDSDGDGKPEVRAEFLSGLNLPYGMAVIGNHFYVANTDAVWAYPYKSGAARPEGPGQKILDLPAGGYNNHWTRNLLPSPDGKKLYVTVGSGSNAAEHGMDNEVRRANVLEIDPDGKNERIYASGLRNPVGMDWIGDKLWVVVNERDELGDQLVPDYATGLVPGGFYGWPYSYFGKNLDSRIKDQKPELVDKSLTPQLPLGSHTASLGLAYYHGTHFPKNYGQGVFIGQHGSWNSSQLVGYKVIYVPFKEAEPAPPPEDFLTGFVANLEKGEVRGRPVAVTFAKDGALLVADDSGNTIWRVAPNKDAPKEPRSTLPMSATPKEN